MDDLGSNLAIIASNMANLANLRGHIINFPLKNIGQIFESMYKNGFGMAGSRLAWLKQLLQNSNILIRGIFSGWIRCEPAM